MGVIITTTNNISCYSIKEYRGAVCANQVLGANVFADFLASWTDFLGGKSGAYRDVLDELFADVRKQMIDKATDVGANAILGFRLSFNELSGKQKSMLMLSGYGTLALVEPNKFERLEKIQKLKSFLSEGLLTQEEYDEEETKISSINAARKL